MSDTQARGAAPAAGRDAQAPRASPTHVEKRSVHHPHAEAGRDPVRRGPRRSSSRTPTRSSKRSAIESATIPDALELLATAGADVDGERVRFPRGMCRRIVQATAPRVYTQHARNPANSVQIGGDATVFAPTTARRSSRPRRRRRYATSPTSGTSSGSRTCRRTCTTRGGTVCEPVDIPVNKRHSTWSTRTCATATSRSWARSRPAAGARQPRHRADRVRRASRSRSAP